MADTLRRKYGRAATVDFELWELDGTDLKVDAAHASGDIKLMKDEGAEATATNGYTDEGQGYSLVLTSTEMQMARGMVYIVDQSGPKVWLDKVIRIETTHHPSAQHPEGVRAAGTVATYTDPTHITVATGLNIEKGTIFVADANTGAGTSAVVLSYDAVTTGAIVFEEDGLTNVLDNTTLFEVYDGPNTVVVQTGTDNKVLVSGDTHTAGVVIDSIAGTVGSFDELMALTKDGITYQQAIWLIAAILAGKLSGAPAGPIAIRNLGDTLNRVTATVDADGNRTAITLLLTGL